VVVKEVRTSLIPDAKVVELATTLLDKLFTVCAIAEEVVDIAAALSLIPTLNVAEFVASLLDRLFKLRAKAAEFEEIAV